MFVSSFEKINKIANNLKLSFSKINQMLLTTSDGKKIFDVFQFNNNEFFIVLFEDKQKFACGGTYKITELNNVFYPICKKDNLNIYNIVKDICKCLKISHILN